MQQEANFGYYYLGCFGVVGLVL